MVFDFEKSLGDNYKIMAQTIIPRPIAWVVSEDEGVVNVAPFSYFIGLSSSPATMLISVGHKSDGSQKDTLANIRKTKKCTICVVVEDDLEKMHFSSKSLNKNQSEAEMFDIDLVRRFDDFPPSIKTSPVAYFCTLNQEIDLEGSSTIPLVLNIKKVFVDDSIITDRERLTISFKPVARIGKSYAFLSNDITPPKIP